MADGLDPVRIAQAMARPGVGEELRALGVRDLSGFGDPEFGWPPWNEARIRQVVDEALDDDEPPAKQQPKQPRQREPDQIAKTTVKNLMLELVRRKAEQRKAELDGRKMLPRGSELTQEKIALNLGLHPTRVQQAEGLQGVGWDLLRSDPDFSADEGFVRWPGAEKAARILDSEPAEN